MSRNDCTVWDLPLPKRVVHCLLIEGVQTIERLSELDSSDLLKIPGIGRRSLRQIAISLKDARNKPNPLPQMLEDMASKLMFVEQKVNMMCEILEKLVK